MITGREKVLDQTFAAKLPLQDFQEARNRDQRRGRRQVGIVSDEGNSSDDEKLACKTSQLELEDKP